MFIAILCSTMADKIRCSWAQSDELLKDYHDKQWGVPVHNDRLLFEMLNLEGAQAGLSWLTILKRRDGYLKAFENFDPHKIILFKNKHLADLKNDEGIIRNRLKIEAVFLNSKAYFKLLEDFSSLDVYLWGFVGERKLTRNDSKLTETISSNLSSDLKKRGFKFVGPTICYAYMQATGLMNDHNPNCFRFEEINKLVKS
jgi:DNA-3-methyladenine glycosylase I